jgi:hypothetical protein
MINVTKNGAEGGKMPTLRELEEWMGTGQVSKYLGYSRQGVINLARERKLRAVLTGAGWLYDPKSVEDFARNQNKGGEDA